MCCVRMQPTLVTLAGVIARYDCSTMRSTATSLRNSTAPGARSGSASSTGLVAPAPMAPEGSCTAILLACSRSEFEHRLEGNPRGSRETYACSSLWVRSNK